MWYEELQSIQISHSTSEVLKAKDDEPCNPLEDYSILKEKLLGKVKL